MKINLQANEKKSVIYRYVYYGILALLLSLAHVLIIDLIAVANITPDLMVILIAWIALREGRFVGIIAGFTGGLVFDYITHDVLGMNALVKTLVAFIAGSFYKEGKEDLTLGGFKFIGIVFLTSLVHNCIYFLFNIKMTEMNFFTFISKYGLAFTFYTTVFAAFPTLWKMRQKTM